MIAGDLEYIEFSNNFVHRERPMTSSHCRLKILTGLVWICWWICSGPAAAGDAVILTTHNLYPYGSYPEGTSIDLIADSRFNGRAVDVVRCVFSRMNTPLQILVMPWERAQIAVRKGNADGFFAASQKNSRDEFAVMTRPIADQKWEWFLLKENPNSPDDPDFREKASFGGFIGANMLKWMMENGYNVTATPRDTELLLKILLTGHVDAVLANNYVMRALIRRYAVGGKIKIYPCKDKPLGVYFSKKFLVDRPGFIQTFNRKVPECRKSPAP